MHAHEYRTHQFELVSLPRLPLGEDKWREASQRDVTFQSGASTGTRLVSYIAGRETPASSAKLIEFSRR